MMGQNAKDGGKVDITPQEFERIKESMKDEGFKKLFFDYMKEISDPENRKLYEAELAQLEAERGNNVRFLKPSPGHVVKTAFTDGEKQKVFVNICTSAEIAPATAGDWVAGGEKRKQSWSIPYSLSQPREDVDHANKKCTVYDCVFNPDTYAKGRLNAKFDEMLVSTAFDGIEREFKVKLEKKYKVPKMKCKGELAQTVIRTRDESSKAKEETTTEFLERMRAAQNSEREHMTLATEKKEEADGKEQKRRLVEELQEPAAPILSASSSNSGPVTPRYTIVHRGVNVDYQKFTNERERQHGSRPDALVIRIELPGVSSAAPVDLDTSEKTLELKVSDKFNLNLQLPFPVYHEKGTAKFDKTKQSLTVTLPVVPAPKFEMPESDAPFEAEEVKEPEIKDDNNEVPQSTANDENPIVETEAPVSPSVLKGDGNEKGESPQSMLAPSHVGQAPFTVRQDMESATFIISVPHVVPDGAKSQLEEQAIQMTLHTKDNQIFTLNLHLPSPILPPKSKVDISDDNAVLVLFKESPQLWSEVSVVEPNGETRDQPLLTPESVAELAELVEARSPWASQTIPVDSFTIKGNKREFVVDIQTKPPPNGDTNPEEEEKSDVTLHPSTESPSPNSNIVLNPTSPPAPDTQTPTPKDNIPLDTLEKGLQALTLERTGTPETPRTSSSEDASQKKESVVANSVQLRNNLIFDLDE
ncbi:Protein kintoun [Borealophlyctis nickersoniae]|nr:Protein kintoun [Borealophlyctis nickersoniae]